MMVVGSQNSLIKKVEEEDMTKRKEELLKQKEKLAMKGRMHGNDESDI